MQNTIAVSNEVGSLLVDRLKRDGVNLYAAAQTAPLVIRTIRMRGFGLETHRKRPNTQLA